MSIATSNEPVATIVSNIIKEKGLKQGVVAQKAGLKQQELSDMLNGRKIMKACEIERLAIVLEIDGNTIMGIIPRIRRYPE